MSEIVANSAEQKLAKSLKIQTISHPDPSNVDVEQFKVFHEFLQKAFPLIHIHLTREVVNNLSLLFTWKGSVSALKPAIFLAHIDVVPISPGTKEDWENPPFGGIIDENFIWGRGTLDCKGFLISIMEAVERLLAEIYKPKRTIYIGFGHDEEIGGWEGAYKIANLLKSRNVEAEYVIDEAGFIVDGEPLNINKSIAAVGIAEKGRLNLKLQVKGEGGHSSMPPRYTTISILSRAINRLEKKQFPSQLHEIILETFSHLSPEMPRSLRLVFKNKWLFGKLIKYSLSKIKAMNAMIRTTSAPTIIEGGTMDNVIPQKASAIVNFRMLPGDSIDYVLSQVKKKIKDPRVEIIKIGRSWEASPMSNIKSVGFNILKQTLVEKFPDTVLAPFLVIGGTDAKHYTKLSDSVYRFGPLRVGKDDQERAHGTNERIERNNFEECIQFYMTMIRNSNKIENKLIYS